MKALLLAALLAQADAPLAERPAMELKAGEVVPFDGVCLTSGKSIEVGKRIAACEAGLAVAESKTMVSTPVLVAAIVGALAVGFAAGAATAYAVSRK